MKRISLLLACVVLASFSHGASIARGAVLPAPAPAVFACDPSRIAAADNSACCRFVCNGYKCFCVWRC